MSRPSTGSAPGKSRMIFLCALAAFGIDFASKSWAEGLNQPLEAGPFALARISNDALAFSLGHGAVSTEGLVLARLAVFALCAFLAVRHVRLTGRVRLGLALIAAGGLGNLVDLPLRGGAVVDFVGVNPVALVSAQPGFHVFFNLADVFIFVGVALAFPLARTVGLRVQRRFQAWEAIALGRDRSTRPPLAP